MSAHRTRLMCPLCRSTGVVWAPKMAVQWGSRESFSLAAPTRCPECRGDGWFDPPSAEPS